MDDLPYRPKRSCTECLPDTVLIAIVVRIHRSSHYEKKVTWHGTAFGVSGGGLGDF